MKRLLVSLLLLAASLGAHASGGGSSPPPWQPSNTKKLLFAYNKSMQTYERVCWARTSDWKYCKSSPASYATEMQDYLNWIFEKQQINLKVVGSGVGLPVTIPPRWYGNHWEYLNAIKNAHGADYLLLVDPHFSEGRTGSCAPGHVICWFSDENVFWRHPPKRYMAHEFGHMLYLDHWNHSVYPPPAPRKAYAAGHGTGSWVDIMHYPGWHGKGLIQHDIYSDHEHWCGFERCGVQNHASAGQFLREFWGRYTRQSSAPPKRDNGHPGHGRH